MRTIRMVALVAVAALAVRAGAEDPPKTPAAAPPAAPPLQPWEFPREFQAAGRRMTVGEPTLVTRDDATGDLTLRFPAQVIDGAGRITWGTIDAKGKSHLDLTSRLVLVDGLSTASVALPQLAEKDREEISKGVPDSLPKELTIRLEILTAGPGAAPAEPATPPKFSMSAPEIIVRRTPAILVQIDGPIEKDVVADFPLEYVVNTASDLFRDPKSDTWYLLADAVWLEAKKLEGPWKVAAQTPIVLSQLKVDHPRGHVRLYIAGTPEYAARTGGKKPTPPATIPEIIVRDKPAELVLLEGDPLFMMVQRGVKLQVVANTESDMLYYPKSGQYYLLVAGRWFAADEVDGPWREAFGGLPDEFAKIPRDHVRGHVAWCVPGTPEAAEAAALATLEERVTISRGTSTTVNYEGKEPRTVPIEGTPIKVVTNTDDDVFVVDGTYWCCSKGVWFRSDDGRGGWSPATKLPAALDQIPEGSGSYQSRACRALGAVEGGFRFGATGAYSGVFLWKGTPIYGTGFSRRGLLRGGNWYPSPRTYGENRWYDPVAGAFQPRNVRYGTDMKATAPDWSPYTASYGRVRWFADRYSQGGRRMFTFTPDAGRFDPSAGRPFAWEPWGTQIKEIDGIESKRIPLGDRTAETAPKEAPVVADDKGVVWRVSPKDPKVYETWKDNVWAAADGCGDREKAWLDTFARINARPAQLRAWAERRRAALPVNGTVTK